MPVKGRHQMLVALCWLLFVTRSGAVSRCVDHACSPPIRNLASGRTLITLSCCCGNGSFHSSPCPHPPVTPHLCPEETHPSTHMNDDPFLHPDTWWASGAGTAEEQDEIRLDLETKFCLSHVVLVFRSPRPAAMAIERSVDFGKTWEALKLFAQNCSMEFGLPDDFTQPGSLCTSRYTSATPCSRGEVIVRTLDPSSGKTLDPYSPEALARLTLTNLRIRLLKAQTCPTPLNPPPVQTNPTASALTAMSKVEIPASAPYAIYTLLARGTCLCHGHAEYCVPHNSSQDTKQDSNMVSGRCQCTHHTAGDHCEKCAPLYNDHPWRPANSSSGEPNPCQKCQCHGHADSCHFSQRAWLSSGLTSGGICDDCRHNTVGRRCQRCRHGYHRRPSLPLNSPHTCTRCWCDPRGSLPPRSGEEGPWCHPRSGQCHCKSGVGGTGCSHCLPSYWDFGEEGCKPCTCPVSCDPITGQCLDSYSNNQVFNVPIGGKIPDMDHMFTIDEEAQWSKELAVSALHYTGKCSCKEKKLRSASDLCKTKHDYMIKASVLSAYDKGSHAEVQVKVRKVLQSGKVTLNLGTISIYPLSWTSRGCTCPILNPGMEYLLAGPEEAGTGRLLVTMQSVVVPWTPRLGLLISEGLRNGCP
ncbi:Netrin-4 Beta-netrin Hepar-derived netrin-like protein [Collichthys lucidus]|uniref:Netrin-4 Beta-netrin Hepar-derived netrin-like protein n=1 Tax=Collichthys lucidus TaxID=240159 RepID=A0A4V6AN31_COLLU|nr:Netrin-4 Beta-netrin Hepar-derived netrin-like protein [Collichthys lucidus]